MATADMHGPAHSRGGFHMRLPDTRLGTVSAWLALAFVVGFFVVNSALVAAVGTSTDPAVNEFSRIYLPYWGMGLMGLGVASGIVGLVAILRDAERSVIVLLTLAPTVFVTLFLLGEFLVPH